MESYYPVTEKWMKEFPTQKIELMWQSAFKVYQEPSVTKGIKNIDWKDLQAILVSHNLDKLEEIIYELAQGYFLLVKNYLNRDSLMEINKIFNALQKAEPSSFHKIYDNVPNFWRNITEELSTKYAVPQVKKTSYWFHWNVGSRRIYQLIMPIYRAFKALGGKSPIEYESNIPSTGKVDRIQIVHYPAGTGRLDPHHDPKESQRLIMSGYTTKRGIDFEGGGFWAMGEGEKKVDMEPFLDPGDFGTCYANIVHGVDATHTGDRGFIGLYTVDSDYVKERDTIKPVKS